MTHGALLARLRDPDATFSPPTEEQALTAYHAALLTIRDRYDAAYYFACMNLLNAYVKQGDAGREFAKRYHFKRYVADAIEHVVASRTPDVEVHVARDVIYARVLELQFSFHNVRLSRLLRDYQASPRNRVQEWSGVRLQPPAALLMEWTTCARDARSH